MLHYYDVFVPGGFPEHTYNPRETLALETQLRRKKGTEKGDRFIL